MLNGKHQNFILFSPKQAFVRGNININDAVNWLARLENANFKVNSIGQRSGRLKFRISRENINSNRQLLLELFKKSYEEWNV